MKRVIATLLVLLFLFLKCFAQINPGARQIALAHSTISSSNDVFSLFTNPAGLSLIDVREAGLFYSPAPFGIKELSTGFVSYCEPTAAGSFCTGFSIYGFDLYRETSFAFGYGKKISSDFFAGIAAIYQNVSIKNYGNRGILLFNAGATARLGSRLGIGIAAENISRSSLADEPNQKPAVLWFGADLLMVKEISFSAALKKEIGFNPSLRIGVEYTIIDFLVLRLGVSNEPETYSGGIGVITDLIRADYSLTSHTYLGLTHQFGLLIHFSKK